MLYRGKKCKPYFHENSSQTPDTVPTFLQLSHIIYLSSVTAKVGTVLGWVTNNTFLILLSPVHATAYILMIFQKLLKFTSFSFFFFFSITSLCTQSCPLIHLCKLSIFYFFLSWLAEWIKLAHFLLLSWNHELYNNSIHIYSHCMYIFYSFPFFSSTGCTLAMNDWPKGITPTPSDISLNLITYKSTQKILSSKNVYS